MLLFVRVLTNLPKERERERGGGGGGVCDVCVVAYCVVALVAGEEGGKERNLPMVSWKHYISKIILPIFFICKYSQNEVTVFQSNWFAGIMFKI